jgi:hypothetical protein
MKDSKPNANTSFHKLFTTDPKKFVDFLDVYPLLDPEVSIIPGPMFKGDDTIYLMDIGFSRTEPALVLRQSSDGHVGLRTHKQYDTVLEKAVEYLDEYERNDNATDDMEEVCSTWMLMKMLYLTSCN